MGLRRGLVWNTRVTAPFSWSDNYQWDVTWTKQHLNLLVQAHTNSNFSLSYTSRESDVDQVFLIIKHGKLLYSIIFFPSKFCSNFIHNNIKRTR
jgi:hypothetical protein